MGRLLEHSARAGGGFLGQTQSAQPVQLQFHALDGRPRANRAAEREDLHVKLLEGGEEFKVDLADR